MATRTARTFKRALSYDPVSGVLLWKESKKGRNADLVAGYVMPAGYRRIQINGASYEAHRIAFAIHYGRDPVDEIDHIDRNPSNNSISNLREATRRLNASNRNSRGFSKHPTRKTNPYQARIRLDGKDRHLGVFPTEEAARAAYLAARRF